MKSLILVAMLIVTVVAAQTTWQEVTSQYSKYTIQYPMNWTVGNAFHNNTANIETIFEYTVLYNDMGAKITIDVWRSHPKLTLDQWLEIMQSHFVQFGEPEKITATQENLPAYRYIYAGTVQAHSSKITVFKHQQYVFRVSYLEKDQGQAIEAYENLIQTMSFDKQSVELSPLPTSRPPTRAYNCGNQNDDCQCSADNPFSCCDNGGNCTWWAWEKACCIWGVGLPVRNHAKYWANDLSAYGYKVSSTPSVDSIACSGRGDAGHVAWVIAVKGTKITVSEMNCGGNYGVRERVCNVSEFTNGFISR